METLAVMKSPIAVVTDSTTFVRFDRSTFAGCPSVKTLILANSKVEGSCLNARDIPIEPAIGFRHDFSDLTPAVTYTKHHYFGPFIGATSLPFPDLR